MHGNLEIFNKLYLLLLLFSNTLTIWTIIHILSLIEQPPECHIHNRCSINSNDSGGDHNSSKTSWPAKLNKVCYPFFQTTAGDVTAWPSIDPNIVPMDLVPL